MKKLIAIIASALTLGAFAKSAADPVITADTSAVESGTTCTVMAGDEELFDFTANGGEVTMELDEIYVGKRICLMANGEEITDSTEAQMGAANVKLAAIKLAGEPTPVAVWEGDFTSTQGGYTITAPEGSTTTIGDTIVIGDAGVTIGTFPQNTQAFTVIVKYSGLNLAAEGEQTLFVGSNSASSNNIGVFMTSSNGGLKGIARDASFQGSQDAALAESGIIAFEHQTGAGTTVLAKGGASALYNNTGLTYSGNNYDSTTIFGEAPLGEGKTLVAGVATGVVIEKIALFRAKLSQDEVNAYLFPSEKGDYVATAAAEATGIEALEWATLAGESVAYADIPAEATLAINGTGTVNVPADFAHSVYLESGVTIVPASGATSGIFTGAGTVIYDNALPTATQSEKYQDKTAWQGVVYLKNKAFNACLDLNPYGNASSTIRLTNVTGYNKIDSTYVCTVPVELVNADANGFGVAFVNGWSYNDRQYHFSHLKGSGKLVGKDSADKVIIRVLDWTGFTGVVQATNKTIVFGTKDVVGVASQIHVSEGATVTSSTFKDWTGMVTIDGTVVSTTAIGADKSYLGSGALVFNPATDHIILQNKITFGGTVKALLSASNDKQVIFNYNGEVLPSRPELILEKTGGNGVITLSNNCVAHPVTVKNLSGNAPIDNRYGNGTGDRTIDTLQTKETTYSGAFAADTQGGGTRKLGLTVRGDEEHQYQALTLSGTNRSTGTLTIAEYGKVVLTGTWAGNFVVDGVLVSSTQIDATRLSCTDTSKTVQETHDEEAGTYTYAPVDAAIPGEELIPDGEKDAYRAWASANDVTAETTTSHDVLAIAFHLEANKGDTYDTIEDAAQAKVKALVTKIDLAALADPEGGEEAALETLNAELAEKGLVASLKSVTLDGASESTKLYQLVIKLIKEN